jgi:hypothetical protein
MLAYCAYLCFKPLIKKQIISFPFHQMIGSRASTTYLYGLFPFWPFDLCAMNLFGTEEQPFRTQQLLS